MNFFEQHEKQIQALYEGNGYDAYTYLGAHPDENGCHFATLAPNADCVTVTGSFNNWEEPGIAMEYFRGIWHTYIPGIQPGDFYKFCVEKDGRRVLKSDPFAVYSELRPGTASIVCKEDEFPFEDKEYFEKKAQVDFANSPVNIYEVHLGSFRCPEEKTEDGEQTFYNFRQIVPQLTNYLLEMGYNYVELLPVCEHPLDASWGYQTVGYFSVTSRYGTPEDFQYFVNYLHRAGIGVILDWVPGHFCRNENGLYRYDGTCTFESDNPLKADNPGWGTLNFDFSRTYVQSFLKSNADYWFRRYHIDGLRVDAVANMLTFDFSKPRCDELKNQYGGYENIEAICFLRDVNTYIKTTFPGTIMCAEDSSDMNGITAPSEIGGLNFTFKWNMGWMNDCLAYMKQDPIHRKGMHDKITFALFYAFNEKFILPLSHDEVVHGKCSMVEKMPGYRKDKYAQLRAFYTLMYGMPGKKLQFMGNEFGHSLEWRFYEELEWNLLQFPEYSGAKAFSAELNHLYLKEPAFWAQDTGWEGFSWIDANDRDGSIFSFARYSKDKDETLVFVINFTPIYHESYTLGVPFFTEYTELLNNDASLFGGENRLNRGLLIPKAEGYGEMPYSLKIKLPPFGAIIFKVFDSYKEGKK